MEKPNTLFSQYFSQDVKNVDKEIRINKIIDNLEKMSTNMVIARFIMCLGVYYFAGALAAIEVFIGFEILRQASENVVEGVKIDLKKNRVNLDEAENRMVMHPFLRAMGVSLVFLFLIANPYPHSRDAALLILFSNLAIQIFQNSESLKLTIAGLIPPVIVFVANGAIESYNHNSFAPLVAPVLFTFVMSALGILAARDRGRGFAVRREMENKTNYLEQLLQEQEKEKIVRSNVERLAKVGTFQWLFDESRKQWSPGAFSAFGFCENEPIPTNAEFLDKIAPDDRQIYIENLRRSRNTGEGYEFGFKLLHDNNEIKSVFCHGAPIYGDNCECIGFEGIVVDQTHVADALDDANATRELLNVALINGRSAVLERNLTTGEMRGYGALDIFEIDSIEDEKYLEDKVMRCLGRRDTHIVFGAIGRAEASGEIQTAEHRIRHLDGRDIHVRVIMGIEGSSKNAKGRLISITTDIGEEVKRREELAKALEESKNASRVKSEFLANMSHEIRTPLNGVIAVTGLLAKTKLDANQSEMVKLVENSGEALSHIINDVLDLARVESGRLEIENIDFNVKEALNSVTSLFGVKADEKGLLFNVDIDQQLDNYFIGDPIRVRQIVGNLISNAIKFTQSGSVSLIARAQKIDDGDGKYNCIFTVKDTGDGMSPEVLARLFERFEQADGSITRKHGGSGLGLSISRALAGLMGGDISVTSAIGLGSAFTLTLPLDCSARCKECSLDCPHKIVSVNSFAPINTNDATQSYKSEPTVEVEEYQNTEDDIQDTEAQDEGSVCILAVDDNATNRRVLDMVLRPMGVDLTLCENGLEAFETFKLKRFDIVLMDLQMPIMDGLTATRKIREFEAQKGTHIPIIAVSANAMSHHVEEAIQAGVDMHIAKPFTPQSLIDGIERGLALGENIANDNADENANCA
jgi:signal transduction histidine kinase/FixJ family two-component response regulator